VIENNMRLTLGFFGLGLTTLIALISTREQRPGLLALTSIAGGCVALPGRLPVQEPLAGVVKPRDLTVRTGNA